MNILSLLFSHPHIVPNLYDFVLWNIKDDILKNVGNQTVWFPLDEYKIEVNGNRDCLVINILQNIFFCFLPKKEMHTCLVTHEGA